MSSPFAATTWDLASWSTWWPVSLTMLWMLSVRIHPFTPTFSASWRSESYCNGSKFNIQLPSCLQVMRLFRLGRVARQIQRFLESSFHLLILMMGFYLIVCHWFACAWWGSGRELLKCLAGISQWKLNLGLLSEKLTWNLEELTVGFLYWQTRLGRILPFTSMRMAPDR